jgi:ankyrin repeat protein
MEDGRVDPSIDHQCCLRYACKGGNVEVVNLLLDHPAVDPSIKRSHPIRIAAKYGHLEVVKRLAKDRRVTSLAALHTAVAQSDMEMCRYLFDNHCDPTANSNIALRTAAEYGHIDMVKLLLEYPQVNPAALDNAALKSSVENKYFDIARLLLDDERVYKTRKIRD